METFGIYSLKAGIILASFWGIYRLFLQKETFYRFNRFFLLAGLIASLLLPLYTIHYTVEIKAPEVPIHMISASEGISQSTEPTETGTGNSVLIKYFILSLPFIYASVLFIIMIVRTVGFSRLLKIIHRSKHKRYSNYTLIESSEFEGAFSFLRFIILPESLSDSEKSIIVRHEETHIEQNHWVDLLLSNILNLMWWFNPVTRLYEKAIKNNHEYLADEEVLLQCGQADYQQTLVNQWLKVSVFPMTNSFSYSNRLKRITMMKKNISNPARKLFSLIAIPAIAVFLCAFAEKDYVVSFPDSDATAAMGQTGEVYHDSSMSMFNGEFTVKIDSVSISLEGCDEQPLIVIDDKVTNMDINDIVFENINSAASYASEDAIRLYGEKGKHGAVALTTKAYSKKTVQDDKSPATEITPEKENTRKDPGTNDINIHPKPVLIDKDTIQKNSKEDEISIKTNELVRVPIDTTSHNSDRNIFTYRGKLNLDKNSINKPLIIIDGKKESVDIENIATEKIHSISVYKDKTVTEKYGEEAKDGVIFITTYEGRKAFLESSAYDIKGTVTDESGNPINNALVKISEPETYTDPNGMFTLRIVPGDLLIIEAEGYVRKLYQTGEDVKITSAQIILKKKN